MLCLGLQPGHGSLHTFLKLLKINLGEYKDLGNVGTSFYIINVSYFIFHRSTLIFRKLMLYNSFELKPWFNCSY